MNKKENKNSNDFFMEQIISAIKKDKIDISDEDLHEEINKIFSGNLDEFANILVKSFNKEIGKKTKAIQKYETGFKKRLYQRWNKPLSNLEYFIHRSLSEGSDFNKKFRDDSVIKKDYRFEALIRIHGQACQISLEILCLLKNGFPQGALARWRTLYEFSVYSVFLSENDVYTSKRYLDFSFIEEFNRVNKIKNDSSESLDIDYFNYISEIKTKLESIHGSGFSNSKGWLEHLIPKSNNRNLKSLESMINMEHMNPFYKNACIGVHAGSDSLKNEIGLMPHKFNDIILAGPTNYGLSTPGKNTLISLNLITTILLLTKPNMDRIIASKSMLNFVTDALNDFDKAQVLLENDELKLREGSI